MKKIISMSFFLLCILIGLVYIFGGESFISNLTEKETESLETYDEKIDREANDYGLEARLPFQKEFHVIGVGEINTSVFLGGSSLHLGQYLATYNDEEKTLFFYDDDHLPSESHDVIVIKEVYSLDSLLEQEVIFGTERASVQFSPIEQEENIEQNNIVINENRQFLDESLELAVTGQKKVEIVFDGQKHNLAEGETKTYQRSKGDIKSKIAVTYFGKWHSSDMKFIVGEE